MATRPCRCEQPEPKSMQEVRRRWACTAPSLVHLAAVRARRLEVVDESAQHAGLHCAALGLIWLCAHAGWRWWTSQHADLHCSALGLIWLCTPCRLEVVDESARRPTLLRTWLKMAVRACRLEVVDESAQHAGHAGARETDSPSGETHFRVALVSPEFEGLPTIKRHRLVYQVRACVCSVKLCLLATYTSPFTITRVDPPASGMPPRHVGMIEGSCSAQRKL